MHFTNKLVLALVVALPLAAQAQSYPPTYPQQPYNNQPYGQSTYNQPYNNQQPYRDDRSESRGQELQELNLSPQQRSELEGVRNQERALKSQLQAARASGNVQQEQAIRAQMNSLRQQGQNYLSPTQRNELQSFRSAHHRRRG